MADFTTTQLRARYDALKGDRKTIEQTWQQIEQLVTPFRGKFFRSQTSEHEVSWRQVQLFDTTAPQACDSLSAAMQGALTSPAVKWFGLRFQDKPLNKNKEAMMWLEAAEDRLFNELQDSNFNIEASEFYLDLCSFGTSIITEEKLGPDDSWQGLDFSAVPIRDAFFEETHKGQVRHFYRRLQWTPIQIIDKFGANNVPEDIRKMAENKASSDHKIEVVFCIYTREDKLNVDVSQPLPPSQRPFGYCYFLHRDGAMLGPKGGYYEMPAFVARWRKVSGSMWGHSPAHICLADILNINELVEATLEAAGKAVDPPNLTTQRGLLSDLDLGRGGLTVVRSPNDLVPYPNATRFDVADAIYELFQRSIRQTYRVDQLQLKESPAMTATEVQVRYELMQRLLGPTLGRLQSDFLDPVVSRTFNLLLRAGELGDVPDVVIESQGQYKVEYTGPLPRAQRMDTVRAMQEWLMVMAQVSEVYPESRDLVNIDEFGRTSGRLMSVPAAVMNSPEQVMLLREQRAEQNRQAVETEQRKQRGEANKALGEGAQALREAGAGPQAA